MLDLSVLEKYFAIKSNNVEGVEVKFRVRLCRDVLLETLLFGDRRQLTELERGGRRFHIIIENYFEKMPFFGGRCVAIRGLLRGAAAPLNS